MPHDTALIATLAVGLGLAFLFGLLTNRLRLPTILGYLLAGVAVGPFTPGFVADTQIAAQLAELGVILLMFGVGLHFSIADLLAVWRIAVPGALAQIAVATLLGSLVSHLWGWSWGTGIIFGLSLSVASTVVLLRALEDRGVLDSINGRIAVGWLIVEDLITVIALVLIPGIVGADNQPGGAWLTLGITLLKVGGFVGFILVVGRRVIPWLLGRVVRTRSRELFTLAVLAIALGIAFGAATLFDVSFALGAFFAGIIVSESDFSHEAATNALPLRDAFAVLFFVSVGMLFDPLILVQNPVRILAVVLIVVVGKSLAALLIVLIGRYPLRTALTISASLAQIGEFSFILAALGVSLEILAPDAQSLIVAGALLTITINPFVFHMAEFLERWIRRHRRLANVLERPRDKKMLFDEKSVETPHHAILVGHGRVGAPVADELLLHHIPLIVVEQRRDIAESLRQRGITVLVGDATRENVLIDAEIERASLVLIAASDAYQARVILEVARRLNPHVEVIARTHSDEERTFLEAHGASRALVGERELAVSLARHALRQFNVPHDMEAVAARALKIPTP